MDFPGIFHHFFRIANGIILNPNRPPALSGSEKPSGKKDNPLHPRLNLPKPGPDLLYIWRWYIHVVSTSGGVSSSVSASSNYFSQSLYSDTISIISTGKSLQQHSMASLICSILVNAVMGMDEYGLCRIY